ncbi:unnamed protein product [Chironomus riparius]|uniref:UDP-glucuronosyltransferase n=1 Tax=Chironomus riparius TaxID=315576 RepID=A0A9N9WS55_9DIPT|nr:unnamed protein product [Chironomus riparius]
MKVLSFLLILISCSNYSTSYQILGILPFETKSHFAIGESIMKTLAEFFHNVTVVSPYPQNQELHFFKDVSIASAEWNGEYVEAEVPAFLNLEKPEIIPSLKFLYQSGEETVNYVMSHPKIIELIESGQTYNACIIENTHFEALQGLAEIFDCILITYTTYPSVYLLDRMASSISPTSYVPNSFLDYTHKMNFHERFLNTFNTLVERIFYEFYHLPNQRRLYQKYFPNAQRSFDDVYKNSSLIFVNDNPVISSPRPLTPNMINIGGIHVRQADPLTAKLQKFLNNAKDGVVVFTMGSNLQGTDWDEEQREAFLKAFGKLKQKVLWKYEDELPNKPKNVKTMKWLPQRDILAHPNVKLFITHGGLLGTFEAAISGVPVLGIPMFGDQRMNVANAILHGNGLKLDAADITEENVSKALNELLNNPKYSENAQHLSSMYKDRTIPAKMQVVYWTEYVIRHKGAPHLRVDANHLNLLQLYSLDVYCSFAVIIAAIIYVNYLLSKVICKKLFSSKVVKEKKQ